MLAVPAKKENGNLGACLIMATDMAHDQWPNLDQFSLFLAN